MQGSVEALLQETSSDLKLDDMLVKLEQLKDKFQKALVLKDTSGRCDFDQTQLEYADPPDLSKPFADAMVFLKINLFVRLWRKLGWTIEETDRALRVFVPKNSNPLTAANIGAAFKTALVYLAHLKALDAKIRVGKNSRLKLLTLWANLPTTGKNPLYAQLFLTRSVLKNDPVFDDPLGDYLTAFSVDQKSVEPGEKLDENAFSGQPNVSVSYDPQTKTQRLRYKGFLTDAEKAQIKALLPGSQMLASLLDRLEAFSRISGHMLALQGALGLTADEIGSILTDAGKSFDTAELSLTNVSLLYRYGLLAKGLKLTVRELIALKRLSGLDPFKPLLPGLLATLDQDHPFWRTLEFVKVAEEVKESEFKVEDLDYLLRHRFDPVGKYRPMNDVPLALVKALAAEIRRIQAEHATPGDATGLTDDLMRQKLALVLPSSVAAAFLGLLTGAVEHEAVENDVQATEKLDAKAFASEPHVRLTYDEVKRTQRLSYRGLLSETKKAQLKVISSSQLLSNLLDAVQAKARQFFANQVETVLELLTGTVEYEAILENVQPTDRLDAAAFAGESTIRVSYDEGRKTQRLVYRGQLLDPKKEELKKAVPSSTVLPKLLDAVQTLARADAEALVEASLAMIMDTMAHLRQLRGWGR